MSFFDTETVLPPKAASFDEFALSTSVNRCLQKVSFVEPTPIQSEFIPIALQGKDICASATTGSGKTAAFLIPTIERLLRAPSKDRNTRCIILSPTRELAAQTYNVLKQLTLYSSLTSLLLTGGQSSPKDEEQFLLEGPDFVVATPGRLVDHLVNCEEVTFAQVAVFILDECDRLLDEGFQNQIEEIITHLPATRQNLLVTATLTSSVASLAQVALKTPVKIEIDPMFSVSPELSQEFVKVEKDRRNAALVAICSRLCTERTVIFFSTKRAAHRMYLIFKTLGMPGVELHGDMSQPCRFEALSQFTTGTCQFLLASDVASRGLDIPGVQNVVNFHMPKDMTQYVHRVGRTARIGNAGRAVSIIGEKDRALMKEIIAKSPTPVHKRTIPDAVLETTQQRIDDIMESVTLAQVEEQEEKELEIAERNLRRSKEIMANPERAIPHEKREFVSKERVSKKDVRSIGARIKADKLEGKTGKREKKEKDTRAERKGKKSDGKKFDSKKKFGKFDKKPRAHNK